MYRPVCTAGTIFPGRAAVAAGPGTWDRVAAGLASLGVVSRILLTWYRMIRREGRLDAELELRTRRQSHADLAVLVALTTEEASIDRRSTARGLAIELLADPVDLHALPFEDPEQPQAQREAH